MVQRSCPAWKAAPVSSRAVLLLVRKVPVHLVLRKVATACEVHSCADQMHAVSFCWLLPQGVMVAAALKNHVHVDAVHTHFIYTIFGVNGYRLCQALCAGVS
jgi:hypothetical protein